MPDRKYLKRKMIGVNRMNLELPKEVGDTFLREAHDIGMTKTAYVTDFVLKAYKCGVFLPDDLVDRIAKLNARTGRRKQDIAIAALRSGLGLLERSS